LEILGTRLNNHRFPEVINWFEKEKVQPKEIITHRFSFTDADKAFKYNDEHPDKVLKIVLTF
jgi:L-gulonate 5-dehydrogenase